MLTAALVLVSPLAAQSPPRSQVAEPVRVGVYQNSPKIGLDDQGRPQGIFIDLIEAIAEREGWQLEFVPGTWQEGLDRLSAGTIDLLPDVARTADRESRFAFHEEPALSSWNQVYARPGSGIRSVLDLNKRSVAVLGGSIQENQLDNMVSGFGIDVDMVSFPDFDAAFAAVRDGTAFAAITNRFYGEFNAAAYDLEDTRVIFAPTRLYFAAPQTGRDALLASIDRHLERFKAAPQSPLYRSLDRWTGDSPPLWPPWLPWAVAALLVLLGSTAAIALILRSQVRARTRQVYEQARQHTRELERRVEDRTRELQENSRFFQSLIDHIPSLIYYKNTALQFTGCNQAYERAFGVDRSELVGRHVTELNYLPLHQRESFEAEQRRLLHAGGYINREVRLTFDDGSQHDMLYSAARIQNDDDEPLGIVGICVDITVQKSVEAQLSRARDQAEAADRVKSAFLATMSHELRTPLNSILGFTGILLQELAGPLNEEQTRQLSMVRNSSKHLLNLINDVLDISRIEAGEMTLTREPFRIAESAESVMDLLRPLAEEKSLELELHLHGGSRERLGDQRRFEQILLNLLGNAIKFTDRGRVSLTVDTRSDTAHNGVLVQVEDTGIGIREEDLPNLFRPFRQIDSTLSRKHEGTGLGLVICKRLTDLMGGDIRVSSQWGTGTRFTVHLPLELATEGQVA
jgi:PAS domain S-box-containing protein